MLVGNLCFWGHPSFSQERDVWHPAQLGVGFSDKFQLASASFNRTAPWRGSNGCLERMYRDWFWALGAEGSWRVPGGKLQRSNARDPWAFTFLGQPLHFLNHFGMLQESGCSFSTAWLFQGSFKDTFNAPFKPGFFHRNKKGTHHLQVAMFRCTM